MPSEVTPTTLRALAATMANHPRWATEEHALRCAANEIERLDREYVATSDDLMAAQARLATAEGMAEALDSIPCPECAEGSTFHGGYAGASAYCPFCEGTGEHPRARAALAAWRTQEGGR